MVTAFLPPGNHIVSEFGNRLKSARELRGITIDQIAQETRISARFLRAIETEAFDELPGGIFNRGFVRNYAEAVGLDGESTVRDYIALTEAREREEADAAGLPADAQESAAHEPAASTFTRIVLPAVAGGLAVLLLLFYVVSQGSSPAPESDPASIASAPRPALPPPGPVENAVEPPIAVAPERTAPIRDQVSGETTLSATTTEPPASGTVAIRTGAETARPGSPLVVRVEVHDATWLYVEVDGQVMYENITINPPFFRNYPVQEALELKIGNPEGVSVTVNGRPVSGLGPPGQVWTGTITPENALRLTGS
jgi:cytoskeleton protein RodZ